MSFYVDMGIPEGCEECPFKCKVYREYDGWRPLLHRPKGCPISGWIPCSEKLPNEDEKVLVSGEVITEEILISKGEYVRYWHNKGFSLAWQPLPKPYKGVSE